MAFCQVHSCSSREAGKQVFDELLTLLPLAAASGEAAEGYFLLLASMLGDLGDDHRTTEEVVLREIVELVMPLVDQLLRGEYGSGLEHALASWHPRWLESCQTATGDPSQAANPAYTLHQLAQLLIGNFASLSKWDLSLNGGLLPDLMLALASLNRFSAVSSPFCVVRPSSGRYAVKSVLDYPEPARCCHAPQLLASYFLMSGPSTYVVDAALLKRLLYEALLPGSGTAVTEAAAELRETYVRACMLAISRTTRGPGLALALTTSYGHQAGARGLSHSLRGGSVAASPASNVSVPYFSRNDATTTVLVRVVGWLLELLQDGVCPDKPEPTYLLVLEKSPTQEEFIRGAMTGNPYPSSEAWSCVVGPLMRDIKNAVCQTLDMAGLLEDDFGMELLVCPRPCHA
eukprot:scaffold79182_cov51-Prasinocladus_malaysianus.AAC.10